MTPDASDVPENCAHVRGNRQRANSRAPHSPRHHGHRAHAGAPTSSMTPLVEKACAIIGGYQHPGFFAPEPSYAPVPPGRARVREFKQMVRICTTRGIEVILDGSTTTPQRGNTPARRCLPRLDKPGYYRTLPEDQRYYMDSPDAATLTWCIPTRFSCS